MLERLTEWAWSWPTIGLFLVTGLWFSVRTGFFQIFGLCQWWRGTAGQMCRRGGGTGGLSPLQTLSTALAATIGTGSIAGVATALTFGGPGAIFWMWVSALLAMMTGWAEKTLSVACRERASDGSFRGGPALWLERKGFRTLSRFFALCVVLASFGMGNLVQSNSLWVIFAHAARLPAALGEIVGSALDGTALFGGGGAAAIQYGLSRGVCTNEAGLGSTPMIHCASGNDDPAKEGNWGIFEVFFATVVVCTITALVILTSGVMGDGRITGALLTAQAFSTVMGNWGGVFVALCLALFGFSSLLGWSWYGRCGLAWLTKGRGERLYYAAFLLLICAGSVLELRPVWQISDIFNALMAWPSLFSLLLWSDRILQCGPEGKRGRKQPGAA